MAVVFHPTRTQASYFECILVAKNNIRGCHLQSLIGSQRRFQSMIRTWIQWADIKPWSCFQLPLLSEHPIYQ